ncbi:MAG TPA: LPS assembly lipoprotein LptE, partial [Bordetella sp.]|nr:LPS assembly lipoprotein LptE [Bordetella sp.]
MHPAPQRFSSRWLLRAASLAAVMVLAACGFALRGVTPLPFDTMYVGIPDNTRFGADVRRALRAASPDTRLVDQTDQAQAILQMVRNERTLREVSLNAQGRVEEYELGILFTFRLIDSKGVAILPDTTLSVFRDMPYDDQVVQAKQAQIESLYQSMQQSLVSRLLRRLTAPDV